MGTEHPRPFQLSIFNLRMLTRQTQMGRIMAIDYGVKRTGLAVTDPERIIATGLTTVATPTLLHAPNILACAEPSDVIVSTTGKLSREVFELREKLGQDHRRDFLTVGSMGHASMIALGVAESKPDRRVWCLDGDGAVMMHLGSLALIGRRAPKNLVHVVVNNGAHETVGGMPVCSGALNITALAEASRYRGKPAAGPGRRCVRRGPGAPGGPRRLRREKGSRPAHHDAGPEPGRVYGLSERLLNSRLFSFLPENFIYDCPAPLIYD